MDYTIENENITDVPMWIKSLIDSEGVFDSPIDINITHTMPVEVPLLEWLNFEVPPKKMKITNTGHTVILSAKWNQERPYITKGPLLGKYVFSQLHLHWGPNDMEGSEHTVDGAAYPGEMHVVMFRSCYLTQEAAMKEKDGLVILSYIFKLQKEPNPGFQVIVDSLNNIQKAYCSAKIGPITINNLVKKFEKDYFVYWGSLTTTTCTHNLLYIITRVPIGMSIEQMESFRYLLDAKDEPLLRNSRKTQPINNRHILHCCPSPSKYATLLPLPNDSEIMSNMGDKFTAQVYRTEVIYNNKSINDTQYSITSALKKIKKTLKEQENSKQF